MRAIGIIPARMASSRFPGKPLAPIHGIPMVGHVYVRSRMCEALEGVYVATCDAEIADYVTSIGGKAVMTSDRHERASDRCAEAMLTIEDETGLGADVVVMIQGDEPMTTPEAIAAALAPLQADGSLEITNLMAHIRTMAEHEDPNVVKVVVDRAGDALYFSREPIPSRKKSPGDVEMLKQVAVIPFRRDFLLKFSELDVTPLEIAESIDMLRVLEHGYRVRMVLHDAEAYCVDTPEDLRKAEEAMIGDPLLDRYRSELA